MLSVDHTKVYIPSELLDTIDQPDLPILDDSMVQTQVL